MSLTSIGILGLLSLFGLLALRFPVALAMILVGVVGTITVTGLDDLIARGTFEPVAESDRLVVGDMVFLGPYPEESRDQQDQPDDAAQPETEPERPVARNLDLVNKLFSIR